MAVYSLERFSILLVEDNSFVRNILEDLLRQFRFGQVLSASDGAEAIDALKSRSKISATGGGVDLIIADYKMTPVNGLLLLRWVRNSKESPNRFIPFIMLSGAADRENVWAARDIGVSEFLAKPFSTVEVYKKILEAIDYPRPFFVTQDYCGPDRRRKKLPPPKEDLRKTTEDDVVTVYSADKVVKPKKPTDVWCFRPPNNLRAKADGGGDGGPGELPMELLEEAEAQLKRASLDFTEWCLQYLSQIQDLCTEALLHPGRRTLHFEKINLLAHELRGQGGTFGHPLVSVVGKMLYECTGDRCREDDNAIEIVKSHVDIMRVVIREKISGDGGRMGRELLESLRQAVEKYSVVD